MEDFPGEPLKLDEYTEERIFELPAPLSKSNIVAVLDNVRYFGISDHHVLKHIFAFYANNEQNRHLIVEHKSGFPEFEMLWANVEFVVENSLEDKKFSSSAAFRNYIYCLEHAHENGCRWDPDTCSSAAKGGHLGCLKYAHENGCPWNEITCYNAAKGAHLDCLIYAHENGCPWDESTCKIAARGGHLDCLKYARENGCP